MPTAHLFVPQLNVMIHEHPEGRQWLRQFARWTWGAGEIRGGLVTGSGLEPRHLQSCGGHGQVLLPPLRHVHRGRGFLLLLLALLRLLSFLHGLFRRWGRFLARREDGEGGAWFGTSVHTEIPVGSRVGWCGRFQTEARFTSVEFEVNAYATVVVDDCRVM